MKHMRYCPLTKRLCEYSEGRSKERPGTPGAPFGSYIYFCAKAARLTRELDECPMKGEAA